MPVPCKNPKYRYSKNKLRLTFCNGKVVEAKSKKQVDLERKYNRKIYKDKKNRYYYITKGKKVYVR